MLRLNEINQNAMPWMKMLDLKTSPTGAAGVGRPSLLIDFPYSSHVLSFTDSVKTTYKTSDFNWPL